MVWRTLIRLIMTTSCLGFVLPVPASLAQSEPPAPERAPRQIVDEDFLAQRAELAAEDPAVAEPSEGIASAAGKLVYQSFRDGNWEIYYSGDEGTDLRRLTTDPAADIEPRLSLDAAQVVFTSKRTGNYELFVVNVDGTGLRQLTNHAAVDGSPAWSPDGRRIAFASDRDGNPEIYVMNADGSGVARLTSAPGYDDEPAWSPDGRQIAFTSRRTGDEHSYHIWVMNADGSGVRQVSSHWYSGNPIWSPDGGAIFFDVANDRGWSRLMSIAAGGGTAIPLLEGFAPAQYFHAWMGSLGFNGSIYFTVVVFGVNGNNLELQDMRLYRAISSGGFWGSGGPVFGSLNAEPDWGSADRQAPFSRLMSSGPVLVEDSMGLLTGVQVVARDAGIAGVAQVELQAKPFGQSDWLPGWCNPRPGQVWVCGLPITHGQLGQPALVRVRAIDRMGNAEPWPASGVEVTPYNTLVRGTVTDARGYPVFGAAVQSSSSLQGQVATDALGRFELRLVGLAASHHYTITAPPIGGPVSKSWTVQQSQLIRDEAIRLPFSSDIVVNGGFEAGLAGWVVAPGEAFSVNTSGVYEGAASLAVSPQPRTHAGVLAIMGFPQPDSFLARYAPDGFLVTNSVTYGTSTRLCRAFMECESVFLTRQPDGRASVAYDAAGTLYVVSAPDGNGTRQLLQIAAGSSMPNATDLALDGGGSFSTLLAAPDGRLHWLRTTPDGLLRHAIRTPAGNWSDSGLVSNFHNGALASGPDGSIALAGCRANDAIAMTWTANTGWSSATTVASFPCTSALISVDPSGALFAQWRGSGDLAQVFAARGLDAVWRIAPAPTATTFAYDLSPNPVRYWLVAPPQSSGPLSVVDTTGGHFNVLRLLANGTWSAPVLLEDSPPPFDLSPTIFALDEANGRMLSGGLVNDLNSMFPWTPPRIISWRYRAADDEPATAEQTIAIPASMNAPTLTFYARHGDIGSQFRVMVRDAVGATVVLRSSASPGHSGGTQVWLDLSPWRGQTVTLVFQAAPSIGGARLSDRVDLDAVHLGDWRTPVIHDIQPALIGVDGGTLTVWGSNLSSQTQARLGPHNLSTLVEGSPGVYTVSVPAGAPVGSWVFNVVNPDGAVGGHALPIHIGRQVYLPVLNVWATP